MSNCNICGAPIFADEPVTNQPCLDCIMDDLPSLRVDKQETSGDRMTGRKSDVLEWALFGWPATIALAAGLIWWVLR